METTNDDKKRRQVIAVRKHRYGVTEEQYRTMLAEQGNACAVCRVSFETARPNIDHDHNCCQGSRSCGKCVRGILCPSCLTLASLMETKMKFSSNLFNYLTMHLIKLKGEVN